MGYNQQSAPAAANTAGNTGGKGKNNGRAVGFLNIYVPTKSGAQKKLGAIYLMDDSQLQTIVAKRLAEGGEEALKAMVNKLTFSFSERNDVVEDDLDLG